MSSYTSYTFYITEAGKLPEGIKVTLANVIPSMAGKRVKLSISEAKEKRSLDQNSYYWVAIVPHVRKVRFDMGDPLSIEAIHEDLLNQYAPTVICRRMNGSVYTRPKRSKEMTVPEMAEYMTAITATMAQFGEPIPMGAQHG